MATSAEEDRRVDVTGLSERVEGSEEDVEEPTMALVAEEDFGFSVEGVGCAEDGVLYPPSRPRSLVLDGDRPQELILDEPLTGSTDLPEHLVSPDSASDICSPRVKGEFSKDGDLLIFTADNLQDQIRKASPLDHRHDVASFWSRAASVPPLPPLAHPPDLPPSVAEDIPEAQSRAMADSVNAMLAKLEDHVKDMSSVTGDCVEVYKDGVDETCDAVDQSIKSMYALMAKSGELNKQMWPMHQTAHKIKEIKRLVDMFETDPIKCSTMSNDLPC